jgi:hypothetical protein
MLIYRQVNHELLFEDLNYISLCRHSSRISARTQLILTLVLSSFMAAKTTRISQGLRPTWISNTPLGLASRRQTFTTGKDVNYQDDLPITNEGFQSTGGSPPFNPDSFTPINTNEPYLDFLNYLLGIHDIPQVLTTSYGDDEQTACSMSSDQEAQP